jgi:hypothetical protein
MNGFDDDEFHLDMINHEPTYVKVEKIIVKNNIPVHRIKFKKGKKLILKKKKKELSKIILTHRKRER